MKANFPNPLACYEALIVSEGFVRDQKQLDILSVLDDLQLRLIKRWGLLTRLLVGKPFHLYLWGEVGRGKTLLVDCLVQSLPAEKVKRIHFYQFMQEMHAAIKSTEGEAEPIMKFAKRLALTLSVLVLDEFMVHDIVDAMLLKQLLNELDGVGIVLVTTSNVQPFRLYEGGLQRSQFMPAIHFIETKFKIVELKSAQDYRLRALIQEKAYFMSNEITQKRLTDFFHSISPCALQANCVMTLDERTIQTKAMADDVVWFDFEIICGAQRGSRDYLALSNLFHTVMIENIPRLDDKRSDEVRRFIMLVDAFYDRGVNLVLIAETRLDKLYRGTRFEKEWPRIESRLIEMQSELYRSKGHHLG